MYDTFKVRTFFHTSLNMPGNYKKRITSIPSIPIYGKSEDSAPSHKARTEIFGLAMSKCPHFEYKKFILVLALNCMLNATMY